MARRRVARRMARRRMARRMGLAPSSRLGMAARMGMASSCRLGMAPATLRLRWSTLGLERGRLGRAARLGMAALVASSGFALASSEDTFLSVRTAGSFSFALMNGKSGRAVWAFETNVKVRAKRFRKDSPQATDRKFNSCAPEHKVVTRIQRTRIFGTLVARPNCPLCLLAAGSQHRLPSRIRATRTKPIA